MYSKDKSAAVRAVFLSFTKERFVVEAGLMIGFFFIMVGIYSTFGDFSYGQLQTVVDHIKIV